MPKTNQKHGLGALLSATDDRRIRVSAVAKAKRVKGAHPKKNITDISMLPVEDQKRLGSCVGQGEGKGEEYRNFKETGKVVRLSKRMLYALCKVRDGQPKMEGTYPPIAAQILKEIATAREELVGDDNDLNHDDFINVVITDELKTDASQFRVNGYAFALTLDEVKTAIDMEGVMNATLMVGDWDSLPVKPAPEDGLHRILFFGYEDAKNGDKADVKIYFRNSWGINWAKAKTAADKKLQKEGNGWFWWSEYEHQVFDMIVYTDMPNTLIDYAKAQQYRFTRSLKPKMSGTDVRELQKRLSTELAPDGGFCYRYKEKGTLYFSTYFGKNTQEAVERYQTQHKIVSTGTPATTGFGQMGPTTMAVLNGDTIPAKQTKIQKWADATQEYEGWAPGSRSYRNNNPGNIKFIGQKTAIGKDSGGFCIFPTYAVGRAELEGLLTYAATGKSKIYKKTMSLLAFYEKYAPSSDNNYPSKYAAFVAARLGVDISTQIGTLVV